ncbi:MAG: hypothetical protein ACJ78Q_03995 [Chloroflexia bacterium]
MVEEKLIAQRDAARARFEELLEDLRGRGSYDVLVGWSGGKDSTYILARLLKEFNLRILAFTFDNGFVSKQAFRNMEKLSDTLGVDHIIYKARFDMMRTVFNASARGDQIYPVSALGRASNICTSCMGLAKSLALRICIEKNIPMTAFGWTPGQVPLASGIFKSNPQMIRKMQDISAGPLRRLAGEDSVRPFFLEEEHYQQPERFPYNISPLAFMEYDETKVYSYVESLGWVRPKDTDPNSTNCLLNSYAIEVHVAQSHFHPYVAELAGLVREGRMGREEALERISTPSNEKVVNYVTTRLGLKDQESEPAYPTITNP